MLVLNISCSNICINNPTVLFYFESLLIKMQVFDLRSKKVFNSYRDHQHLDLAFHWVSNFIQLNQMLGIRCSLYVLLMSLRT